MACFVVPAVEAVVTAVAVRVLSSKEKKNEKKEILSEVQTSTENVKLPFSRKLKWLTKLLSGGSLMLAFEHMWHGELQLQFPFLTAASTPESTSVMLNEMATVGVGMSALVTVAWLGMLVISSNIEKRAKPVKITLNQEGSRI